MTLLPSRLDRYIARSFLVPFVWSLVAMIALFVLIDSIEMLDKFIGAKTPAREVLRYYGAYLPAIVRFVAPIAVMLGAMFGLGALNQRAEIVAMRAAGWSNARVLWPVVLTAVLVALGAFWLGEKVIPWTDELRSTIRAKATGEGPSVDKGSRHDLFYRLRDGRILWLGQFTLGDSTGEPVSLWEFRGQKLERRLDGVRFIREHGAWRITKVSSRTLSDTTLQMLSVPETTLALPLRPSDLSYVAPTKTASIATLDTAIELLESSGRDSHMLWVQRHSQFAFPASCIVVVIFGAALASNFRRGGRGGGLGLAILLLFLQWIALSTGQTLANDRVVEPWVGAWAADIGFGAIALVTWWRSRV